jgi:hypothetical protein
VVFLLWQVFPKIREIINKFYSNQGNISSFIGKTFLLFPAIWEKIKKDSSEKNSLCSFHRCINLNMSETYIPKKNVNKFWLPWFLYVLLVSGGKNFFISFEYLRSQSDNIFLLYYSYFGQVLGGKIIHLESKSTLKSQVTTATMQKKKNSSLLAIFELTNQ